MTDPAAERENEAAAARHGESIAVWDLPIRLFHWLTVALVAAAYVTWRLNWMVWHARAGYALLTLLLFRLAWGFFGAETARFRGFLASPAKAARHLKEVLRNAPEPAVGHNPAGGWMVLLMLALLLGQTLTGLYVDNDIANEGPWTELVPAFIANAIESLHDDVLWDALVAAIALHGFAIVVYASKGQNLTSPMITGRMIAPHRTRPPRMASLPRAALLLACSALIAAGLVRFL